MKEKYSWISDSDLDFFEQLHNQKENDWYNNQFHLSGYCGSINDPNGLIYLNNKYYIFMQNCPFSIKHFNKSWALYTTVDFINYTYEGITLTPSSEYDKHGVFTGSARLNKKNEIELFYTGNIKFDAINRTSTTIKATIDLKNKIVTKELLFKQDLNKYSGHFRDPIVVEKNKQLFMLNGAQTIDKKAVLNVHKFNDEKWINFKDLKFDENDEQNAYMLECPNYFKLTNKEYLAACLEQEGELIDESHFVKYREVEIDNDFNIKYNTNLIKIDLGFDFYAPQIFSNTGAEVIMIAWLGNSKSNPFPKELTTWSNQLTIPRNLFIKNNKLAQLPLKNLTALRLNLLQENKYKNGTVELYCDNIKNQNFFITISNEKNENITIENKNNSLIINRNNTSFKDELNLPAMLKNDNLNINTIQILIDRSVLEIFINEGEYAIAVRFYVKYHNSINTNLKNVKLYQLKGYNYKWNNIIFKNVIKGEH